MDSPAWRWRFSSPGRGGRRRSRVSSLRIQRDAVDDDLVVPPPQPTSISHHAGVRLSAAQFLLGPKPTSLPDSPASSSSPPPPPLREQQQYNQIRGGGTLQSTVSTPFLTMALLKLDNIFLEYCLHISQAHFEAITRAGALLDSTVATAGNRSPSSTSMGSPPRSPRSPMSKRFLQWLPERTSPNRGTSRSLSPPTASSSALALEGEWDNLQHGFLILATAEYLYKDVQQSKRGRSLRGLYEYVLIQLEQVHATLCEPFLAIPTVTTTSRENKYVAAARSVAQTLQCLLILCQARIQLIDIQSNLFTVSVLDNVKDSISTLLAVTEASLKGNPNNNNNSENQTTTTTTTTTTRQTTAGDPIKDSLINELKVWKHLLEASAGLERCEFFTTLVSIRRCQNVLQIPCRTRLEKWFDETCRVLISLLPLYFDRVSVFTNPLYGFDPLLVGASPFQDWEAKVTEFLRKQERAGGPPTAVAIVLDALGADNLHLERGFQVQREDVKEMDAVDLPNSVLWPPVYIRSTLHLSSASPHQRSSHGKSSNPALHRRSGSSTLFLPEWTTANHTSDRSSSMLSTRTLDLDPHLVTKKRVLEYGPEVGTTATSWPHNDWSALVSLLEISPVQDDLDEPLRLSESGITADSIRMAEEPVAVTYREDDEVHQKVGDSTWKPSLEKAVRMFGVYASSDMNAVDAHTVREHEKRRSAYHIVSLSKYLSLVVMVKEDEESHFLRRRTPLTDGEIRDFMNRMATHWKVSRRFSHESLPKPLSSTRLELVHDEWDDQKLEDFIHKIKSTLGLRPPSFPLTEGHRGISFLGVRNSPKKTLRRRESPPVSAAQSAAVFFLGAELANLFDL